MPFYVNGFLSNIPIEDAYFRKMEKSSAQKRLIPMDEEDLTKDLLVELFLEEKIFIESALSLRALETTYRFQREVYYNMVIHFVPVFYDQASRNLIIYKPQEVKENSFYDKKKETLNSSIRERLVVLNTDTLSFVKEDVRRDVRGYLVDYAPSAIETCIQMLYTSPSPLRMTCSKRMARNLLSNNVFSAYHVMHGLLNDYQSKGYRCYMCEMKNGSRKLFLMRDETIPSRT